MWIQPRRAVRKGRLPCPSPLNTIALLAIAFAGLTTAYAQDALASWNDGPAKQAIVEFVAKTTTAGSPQFVRPPERIATVDQDGTLGVDWKRIFAFEDK